MICLPCANGMCGDCHGGPCGCQRLHPMPAPSPELPGGCWLAYYHDWSAMAVFDQEIDALRYALDKAMAVRFVEWGAVR